MLATISLKRYLKFVWVMDATLLLTSILILSACHNRKSKAVFTGTEKSIAVLPFINADSTGGNDYLSEGITGEIVHRLSGLSGLRVASVSQVKAIKESHLSLIQIAKALKVASILEGEIKIDGQSMTIHVNLIDGSTGNQIWSRDFNGSGNELFSFQNDLAQVITEELHTEITREEKAKMSTRPTQNLEAYDQYLKGIYFWNKRDPVSLRKGIDLFNQAILLDSNYARAWSGLADCYSALGYGSLDAPSIDFGKAEMAAKKALSLDSTLPDPHTSLGYIDFYYYWDWQKAEEEFLTAIRLKPEYPLAHDAYAYFLTARERYAEAAVEIEKAYMLDPASAFIQTDRGFTLFYAGQYDRAIPVLKEVLIRYPRFPLAWLWLGRTYQEKKMFPESITAFGMAMNKDSAWPVALAARGFVYGISGQRAEAEKRLKQMTDLMKHRYVTPYAIALVYAGMKNKDKTFEWLNRAYTERTNWLVWLKQDPRWVYLKNDLRYLSLLQKIGLSPETPSIRKD